MIKTAYHVTTKENAILIEVNGLVKPMRLPNVYLLSSFHDSLNYADMFKLDEIIEVDYDTKQVSNKWFPKYAKHGVIKLKTGECATFVKGCINADRNV